MIKVQVLPAPVENGFDILLYVLPQNGDGTETKVSLLSVDDHGQVDIRFVVKLPQSYPVANFKKALYAYLEARRTNILTWRDLSSAVLHFLNDKSANEGHKLTYEFM
jgi:hypothetical protein